MPAITWVVIFVFLFLVVGSFRKIGEGRYEFSGFKKENVSFLQKIGFIQGYDEVSLFLIVLICLTSFILSPSFKIFLERGGQASFSFLVFLS